MAEGDMWKRKESLKNTGEALEEFEGRMNVEIRRQKKETSEGESYQKNS